MKITIANRLLIRILLPILVAVPKDQFFLIRTSLIWWLCICVFWDAGDRHLLTIHMTHLPVIHMTHLPVGPFYPKKNPSVNWESRPEYLLQRKVTYLRPLSACTWPCSVWEPLWSLTAQTSLHVLRNACADTPACFCQGDRWLFLSLPDLRFWRT